jgi:hypothetical protein
MIILHFIDRIIISGWVTRKTTHKLQIQKNLHVVNLTVIKYKSWS